MRQKVRSDERYIDDSGDLVEPGAERVHHHSENQFALGATELTCSPKTI